MRIGEDMPLDYKKVFAIVVTTLCEESPSEQGFMAKKRGKRKRRTSNMSSCVSCCTEVPSFPASLNEHFTSKKHIRLEKVFLSIKYLELQGLKYMDGQREMECSLCNVKHIQASMKVIQGHLQNSHGGATIQRSDDWVVGPPNYVGADHLIMIYATHLSRPKVFWKEEYQFDLMATFYKRIFPPACIVEEGSVANSLLTVVNGHFTIEELTFMTTEASFLEEKGNPTKRGELKGGTRMVSYGARFAYGKLGWFVHDEVQCYSRSEALATFISTRLTERFPSVFTHLEKIRETEQVPQGVGCIGKTPFTGMSITKNYNCDIHRDEDDYSYGFFVWLGHNGSTDESGNSTKVFFPSFHHGTQQGYFLEPNIGDVLVFKGGLIEHCSKSIGNCGQFGIALYQKASFFRWYDVVQERIQNQDFDGLVQDWEDSNDLYYSRCSESI